MYSRIDLFVARLVCFDEPPVGELPPQDGGGEDTPKDGYFSQEDINKFLANDRRKHAEKYQALESSYKKLIEQKDLAAGDRRNLQEELENLQKTFRTKEQQAEYEKKQIEARYKTDLERQSEAAKNWETRYKQNMLNSSLHEAATKGGAFNTDQITSILRPAAQIIEVTDDSGKSTGNFTTVIDFPDVDEKTGDRITTRRTPEEAVQRMRELPNIYGNLFTANLNGGIGGHTDSASGKPVDVTKLTYEQYKKMRTENKGALYGGK